VGTVILLSFTAALNPTLVAATTVMLLLPNPAKLMLGYLLGAYMTSITFGILIVYVLEGSGTSSTTQRTLSPVADLVLGALAVIIAFVLGPERAERRAEQRLESPKVKKEKGPPRWQQALSKGSPRVTFLIGACLTLPGASYIAGMTALHKLHYSTAETVLIIIGFNLVMLLLLEVPLLCYAFAPNWTPGAVERAQAWVGRHWRSFAFWGLLGIGGALILKGVLGLIIG
jgi:hypothetical protein